MNALAAQALAGVRAIQPYQPGKPIEELQRELGITDIVKLASNENPLGAGPLARAALQQPLQQLHLYPDGNGFALRCALSAVHDIAPERIVLGNGSNDVLELIARSFLAPGRQALFSEHAFAVYPLASLAAGADLCVVPALPADHPEQPLGHNLQAMAAQLNDRTAVVFIANPNNPTGTWCSPQVLEAFMRQVPAVTAVVLDEAYFEYMDAAIRPDSRAWLERFPNLIITRTFSKIHALAGLRVGYAMAHAEVADLLNRVRQPFNVNALAQAAAVAALNDSEHLQRSLAINQAGMQQLRAGLQAMGLKTLPSQANFLAFDCGRDSQPVFAELLRKGIILRPLAGYQMPSYLRITIGTAAENQRALAALQQCLESAPARMA